MTPEHCMHIWGLNKEGKAIWGVNRQIADNIALDWKGCFQFSFCPNCGMDLILTEYKRPSELRIGDLILEVPKQDPPLEIKDIRMDHRDGAMLIVVDNDRVPRPYERRLDWTRPLLVRKQS